MSARRCMSCGERVSWLALGASFCLFLLKFILGIVSHSHSLQADGLQSLACVIITIAVLVSIRIAQRPVSENYAYGYGKIEFLVSCLVNFCLLFFAALFLITSLVQLAEGGVEQPPDIIAVGGALISMIVNEAIFRYGRCAAQHLNSPALLANAWNNRADAVTSLGVTIAVVGSNLGLSFLDHMAAVFIVLVIIKIAVQEIKKAIKGLMDYSPKSISEEIRSLAGDVENIIQVKDVRTRLLGRKIWVDMEIMISADCMLDQGLQIARNLKQTLIRRMSNIADVAVRLSPAKEG